MSLDSVAPLNGRLRRKDGRYIFLVDNFRFVPVERGRWLRTDRCVADTECPQCLAPAGFPCEGVNSEPTAGTHVARRPRK